MIKNSLAVLLFFMAIPFFGAAQLSLKLPASTPNAGSLLSQFTNAIKPTSFTDAWSSAKSGFLNKLSGVKDAAGLGSGIATLAGFIKPTMFKSGFNVQNLITTAGTVKKLSDAAGLLKNLEGGLKPAALISSWASKRTGWLNALQLIK